MMTKKQAALMKLIERFGIERTASSVGMNYFELYQELDGFLKFTPEFCDSIISAMLIKTNLLRNEEKNFTIYYDNFVGTINWDYSIIYDNIRISLHCLATPFWDGNESTPIDFLDYQVELFDSENQTWVEELNVAINTTLIHDHKGLTNSFKNLQDLINWFNDDYFNRVKLDITLMAKKIKKWVWYLKK